METDGVGRVSAAAPKGSRVQGDDKMCILNQKQFDFLFFANFKLSRQIKKKI
jgi:hypothetical protein